MTLAGLKQPIFFAVHHYLFLGYRHYREGRVYTEVAITDGIFFITLSVTLKYCKVEMGLPRPPGHAGRDAKDREPGFPAAISIQGPPGPHGPKSGGIVYG